MPPQPNTTDRSTLTVHLRLPDRLERFVAAEVRVRLLDIGLADAPAPVLAAAHLAGVECEPGGRLALVLHPGGARAEAHQASVQAHVSRHGAASWSTGDLVTTQSWPVAPEATEVTIQLQPI